MNLRIKLLALLTAGLLAGLPQSAHAQKDVAEKAEYPDGLALYRTSKNKVYLGIPESMLGRRILIGGAVTAVSDPGAGSVGQRPGPPQCFQVDREDSLVVLSRPLTAGTSGDPDLDKAMERNFIPAVYRKLPILFRSGERLVFDITQLVTKAAPKSDGFKPGSEDGTSWYGAPKAFSDNASIRLYQSMEANGLGGKSTVSMVSTVSVLVLPETPMQPRLQDSRIGTFSTGSPGGGNRFDLSTARDGLHPYRLANRWRVEPADPEAWQRGETVPVKHPIVWYVDDSFPSLWKQPIREGVLAWNAAFEAFGFRDVLQVRDFPAPEEDPEFDPDNLRYNCIRFVPDNTANAMGPSWTDPLTGEIINAQVLVFNDVVRLLNNWRFVQTAQVDPRVRGKKLPDDVLQEALVYVVSHEIGHTLGLLHNMAGSAAIPVDSLRSSSFTAVHGTTATIMDYARFNYVAQPGDRNVRLTPPSLGVYDRYAIEWLYKPTGEKDLWEDSRMAGKLIEAHAGDPFYRFGAQQLAAAAVQYDPSSRTQDLGNDPVLAGRYGVDNLRYILDNLENWVDDDPDYSHRKQLYGQLCTQYARYLGHALAQVGGMKLYPDRPAVPVTREAQREALEWVLNQVRTSGWLDRPALTAHFGLHAPESNKIAATLANNLAGGTPLGIVTATQNGSGYSLDEYYDDLFRLLFHGGALTPQERALQRGIVSSLGRSAGGAAPKAALDGENDICFGEAVSPTQSSVDVSASNENAGYRLQFLLRVEKAARHRRHSGTREDRAHYEFIYRTASSVQ
jgi:hypothetical protein